MRPIPKIEILINEANLLEKILFGRITRHLDPENRKIPARGTFRDKGSTFHSVHNLPAIERKVLFL